VASREKDGIGKFEHDLEALPIDKQTVIRTNRDALYSVSYPLPDERLAMRQFIRFAPHRMDGK
jgi:hypothetical protein